MADFTEEDWLKEHGLFACLKTNNGDYCTILEGNQNALIVVVSFEYITASNNPHVSLLLGAERDLDEDNNPSQIPYFSLHCKIPLSSIEKDSPHLKVIKEKNPLFEHYAHIKVHGSTSNTVSQLISLSFKTQSITVDSPPSILPQLKIEGLARKIQEIIPEARRTTPKNPTTIQFFFNSSDYLQFCDEVDEFGDMVLRVGTKSFKKQKEQRRSMSPRSRNDTPIRDREEEHMSTYPSMNVRTYEPTFPASYSTSSMMYTPAPIRPVNSLSLSGQLENENEVTTEMEMKVPEEEGEGESLR